MAEAGASEGSEAGEPSSVNGPDFRSVLEPSPGEPSSVNGPDFRSVLEPSPDLGPEPGGSPP